MRNTQVCAAWATWECTVKELGRQRHILRKFVVQMRMTVVRAALQAWRHNVAEARLVHESMRDMADRRSHVCADLTLATWRRGVQDRLRQARWLAKSLTRRAKDLLSAGYAFWSQYRKRKHAMRLLTAKATRNLRHGLASAWLNAWQDKARHGIWRRAGFTRIALGGRARLLSRTIAAWRASAVAERRRRDALARMRFRRHRDATGPVLLGWADYVALRVESQRRAEESEAAERKREAALREKEREMEVIQLAREEEQEEQRRRDDRCVREQLDAIAERESVWGRRLEYQRRRIVSKEVLRQRQDTLCRMLGIWLCRADITRWRISLIARARVKIQNLALLNSFKRWRENAAGSK